MDIDIWARFISDRRIVGFDSNQSKSIIDVKKKLDYDMHISHDIICRDSTSAVILISFYFKSFCISFWGVENRYLIRHTEVIRALWTSVIIEWCLILATGSSWLVMYRLLYRVIVRTRFASFRSSTTLTADSLAVAPVGVFDSLSPIDWLFM